MVSSWSALSDSYVFLEVYPIRSLDFHYPYTLSQIAAIIGRTRKIGLPAVF